MDLKLCLRVVIVGWISTGCGVLAAGIRCYCSSDSPAGGGGECGEGHMCHSALGKCFSQLSQQPGGGSRHGCLEMLAPRDRHVCQTKGDIIKRNNPVSGAGVGAEWQWLMCCKETMCNYIHSRDTVQILVNTSHGAGGNGTHGSSPAVSPLPAAAVTTTDRWFEAAVIAVPIAGALILVLLILLAVRMLRADNQAHALAKAQLYVDDHFYTAETNSKYYDTADVHRKHLHPQYHQCSQRPPHTMPPPQYFSSEDFVNGVNTSHGQIYYPHHIVSQQYDDSTCKDCYIDYPAHYHRLEYGGYEHMNECNCISDTGSEVSSSAPSNTVIVTSTRVDGPGTIV